MGRILLDGEQRRDWLRLISSENVGPVTFRQLINRFGSAGEALKALPDLAKRGGLQRPIRIYPKADAEQDIERVEALDARLVAYGEDEYPPLLRKSTARRRFSASRGKRRCSLYRLLPSLEREMPRPWGANSPGSWRQNWHKPVTSSFRDLRAGSIRLATKPPSNRARQPFWLEASTSSIHLKMKSCIDRLENLAS
jgi:DprA/Smf-like nucleotide binding protein involved in DNA uptake